MQHAQAGLQAVEAETCPGGEVVGETLVVHDFESGWSGLAGGSGERRMEIGGAGIGRWSCRRKWLGHGLLVWK